MSVRLYVGNLPTGANEAILRMAFGQNRRKVTTVEIVFDERTGKPKGHAYVNMASEADALAAIRALDGSDLDGRALQVTPGEQRRASRVGTQKPLTGKVGELRPRRS